MKFYVLHVTSLKCVSCRSCKCFRSEATLFGCLKRLKDPTRAEVVWFGGIPWNLHGGYAQWHSGQIRGFLARKLH